MVIGIDCSRAFSEHKTGTENYSYHLVKHLLRVPDSKQHKFVLFIRPNAVIEREIVGYSNVIIKEIKLKYLWTQVGLAWETWQQWPMANGLWSMLDVLWIPAHTLPVLRKPGIRTIVTIHGLEYQWLPEYKNWLQKWYLPLSTIYATKKATKLIAVSEFTKKQLEKELHTSSNKIKVIYEGVDCAQCHSDTVSLQKYGVESKKYALFVGTVQPRKNLVALVEAFAKTQIEKLVIAGGVGWMAEDILRAPLKYGVQDRIVFTGRVSEEELESLYLGAGVYVQPSVTEGFGLPVLEAMAMGIPVISSDGGALREVVGEAGVIIKLGNRFVERLAIAIKRVIDDKKLHNTLISMGYERVKEFSWEKTAQQTLNVLTG
ncbi:MAG: glycosyltransferase family 1 protein [bacterium]